MAEDINIDTMEFMKFPFTWFLLFFISLLNEQVPLNIFQAYCYWG